MWPFKRKPKVKAVEPPPPPPPEPVEEKPPEPTWEDRIAKVISDRGQLLRDELDALIDAWKPADIASMNANLEAIFAMIQPMFSSAHNNDTCPCQTDAERTREDKNPFKYCCKPRFKAIKQMFADQSRAKRQEQEAAHQEEAKLRADERSRENISWMVRIGQDERGRIMMDPLDTSRKFSARQVCDALEISAWQAREMIMGEAIQQKIVQFLVRTAQTQQPRK